MALADREYMREGGGRRGGGGGGFGTAGGFRPSMLSMTAWLIIINVAVFAIDRVVTGSGRGVETELATKVTLVGYQGDYDDLVTDPNGPTLRSGPGLFRQPLYDRETGQEVGYRLIAYKGLFESLGYFSTVKITELEVWRFVTFQFLHANLGHLFMNMLGLFFFGPIAERYLASRRLFLAFYLTCGMAGAGLYLLLNLAGWVLPVQLPLVLANEAWVPLVGASAGVFGVLWAGAYLRGRDTMYVMGVIPVQIRIGVAIFTAIAFINLLTGGNNAGGDAAHLGGAIAGAYFIRRPHLLLDFFDEFMGTSERHPAFARKGGKKRSGGVTGGGGLARSERKMNALLDKIKDGGMASLTEKERSFLDREQRKRARES
ncbi:MAG: rhomboid family intramembrane serine protease [Planctomycetota bacterium]